MGSAMDELTQALSSSEDTDSTEEDDSGEEDEDKKAFVRRERMQQKKNADKPVRSLYQGPEVREDGDEQDQSDQDDGEEAAGTQVGRDSETSSSHESADHDSETSSASEGSRHAVVNANANASRGRKEPAAEVLAKPKPKPDASPKKRKEKASKRNREEQSVPDNSPSKRQKDESFDRTTRAIEHVSKGKDSAKAANRVKINTSEKKSDSKKSGHASASAERSEDHSAQQNSVKKLEAKKADEKLKNSRRVPKNEETEHAGVLSSPAKPKLFTGKDEIVLTSEILRDIQRGVDVPSKESDEYWSKFAERVDERMEGSWSKEQLCKKLKRMKQRFMGMAEKFKNSGEHKFRNAVDEELYAMWSKMWGDGNALNADADDVKNKKSQSVATASPVKAGKASLNKAAGLQQDVKVVKSETAARKSVSNSSQSEESNGGSDSPNEIRTVTLIGTESKDTYAENNLLSHSTDVLLRTLCKEIHAILAEVQESSRKNQKHWQSRALTAVEMAIKAFADQARSSSAFHMGSFDGSGILSRNFDLSDSHLYEGDHTLQQEWRELRLKELEVYRQRLELVQRECQLKEERLKVLLQKRK